MHTQNRMLPNFGKNLVKS